MVAAVDKRIAGLRPWVSGFSAYVQRLIYLDLTHNVIGDDGGVNEDAVKPPPKGRKRPKNYMTTPVWFGAAVPA